MWTHRWHIIVWSVHKCIQAGWWGHWLMMRRVLQVLVWFLPGSFVSSVLLSELLYVSDEEVELQGEDVEEKEDESVEFGSTVVRVWSFHDGVPPSVNDRERSKKLWANCYAQTWGEQASANRGLSRVRTITLCGGSMQVLRRVWYNA